VTDRHTLLIVDDDRANLDAYSLLFSRKPYELLTASSGAEALRILRDEPVDVVLTDLKMPDVDGLEVVRASSAGPQPAVSIVVTAYGTIETAVEAMRRGAFDYITKPVHPNGLVAKVEKAFEIRALQVKTDELQGLLVDKFKFEGVIGVSRAMLDIVDQARMVARSRASVLIEGESGTGKELIARALHFNSPRAAGPFVPIHCAALPETLLESELFGHEKGAYTGADQRRIGQFESAEGGTVFLDELAEIPLATQVKLLRVIEQREITRVGATRPIPIDIRLVAATNKNLDAEVAAGRFREDLFYRLNVIRLRMPALRERPEDIPYLVRHFVEELAKENRRSPLRLTPEAVGVFEHYPWPGNIRELRNAIEQVVIFADSNTADVFDLPTHIREQAGVPSSPAAPQTPYVTGPYEDISLAELETRHILETLERMGGNRTHAAGKLGISRRTLQRKLKELGLDQEGEAQEEEERETN